MTSRLSAQRRKQAEPNPVAAYNILPKPRPVLAEKFCPRCLSCCSNRHRKGSSMSDFHRRLEEQIPRLRRYARALTRDASRADDLVQDTLLRALNKQHLWQEGTNLRAWLFTLMHNQHINDVRRSNRDGGNVDVTEMAAVLVANTDPAASRKLRELERALGLLPL